MVQSMTWLLFGVAWKSTVLLLAAFVIDYSLFRRRPLASDTLWSAVFLVLAALPILVAMLPSATLRVSILSSDPVTKDQTALATNAAESHPLLPPERVPTKTANSEVILPRLLSPTVEAAGPAKFDRRVFIVVAYISVTSWLLNRFLFSFRASAKFHRCAMQVKAHAWTERLELNRERLAIRRPVELLHSPQVVVPFTMGWRRPSILVPTPMVASKGVTVIDATLIHELTHLVRHDYPVLLASQLIRCIYWFNPLVWLAVRRLNEVREIVCDCYSISLLPDRGDYIGVLLDLARTLPDRSRATLGLSMARTNRLEKRLLALSFCSVRRSASTPLVRIFAAMAAVIFAVVTSFTSIHAETAASLQDTGNESEEKAGMPLSLATKDIPETPVSEPSEPSHDAKNSPAQESELLRSAANLRKIMSALLTYHDMASHYPPAHSGWGFDRKTNEWFRERPFLSWRVALLPLLGEGELFSKFNLNEPWDSEHNRQLLPLMPEVYRTPGSKAGNGKTNYLGVIGPDAVFPGKGTIMLLDVVDGASMTIMLVEASDEAAAEWTRPKDFPMNSKEAAKELVGLRKGGFLTIFADGAEHFISSDIPPETLESLFRRNDRIALNGWERWVQDVKSQEAAGDMIE